MSLHQDNLQLWIDGSSEYSSIALSKNEMILESWVSDREKGHVEDIPVKTMELLKRNACMISSLSSITVCNGPGSYTGLRISYAWALGLSSPHSIPCYEYNRPLIIDHHFGQSMAPILIHARRDDYRIWSQERDSWKEQSVGAAQLQDYPTEAFLSDELMDLPSIEIRSFDRSAVDMFLCFQSGISRKPMSHPVYFNPPYITQAKKALF